jgi:hypothetical protein
VAFGDDAAVQLFDGDALGGEVGLLIGSTEGLYRRPFPIQGRTH